MRSGCGERCRYVLIRRRPCGVGVTTSRGLTSTIPGGLWKKVRAPQVIWLSGSTTEKLSEAGATGDGCPTLLTTIVIKPSSQMMSRRLCCARTRAPLRVRLSLIVKEEPRLTSANFSSCDSHSAITPSTFSSSAASTASLSAALPVSMSMNGVFFGSHRAGGGGAGGTGDRGNPGLRPGLRALSGLQGTTPSSPRQPRSSSELYPSSEERSSG